MSVYVVAHVNFRADQLPEQREEIYFPKSLNFLSKRVTHFPFS